MKIKQKKFDRILPEEKMQGMIFNEKVFNEKNGNLKENIINLKTI